MYNRQRCYGVARDMRWQLERLFPIWWLVRMARLTYLSRIHR
jgi:hypothetical protein